MDRESKALLGVGVYDGVAETQHSMCISICKLCNAGASSYQSVDAPTMEQTSQV